MKKTLKTLLSAALAILTLTGIGIARGAIAQEVESTKVETIYFFYGNGCPHCSQVEEYFQNSDIYERYPIISKEIYFNRENAVLFNEMLDERGVPKTQRGVPTLVVQDEVIVGDVPIIDFFKSLENNPKADDSTREIKENIPDKALETDLTLLAVVGASLVDAINPCAFAVLIILMTTILAAGDHKKALKSGVAFASSIFISYLLMGLGLYKALGISSLTSTLYNIIGWLAIVLGLLNLKDWLWYGKGFLMEVPQSWRPKLKGVVKSATSPASSFFIGFAVSLFLLPCTSGPYIVILGMLAQKTEQARAIAYLVLYNLIFVSPMLLITYLVFKGLDPKKAEALRQKHLKNLHLIAGIILIGMGILILTGVA